MCADKSLALYAVINEDAKDVPLHYAVPARAATIEKTNGMETPPGSESCKEIVTYEEIKGSHDSLNESLNYEEVKEEATKKNTRKTIPLCPVKYAVVIAFTFVMALVVVSVLLALFLQIRTLLQMNRALQISLEKLHHDKSEITEQTNLSHLYNLVLSMDYRIQQLYANDFIPNQKNITREILTNFSDFYFSSCSDITRFNFSYASGNYVVRPCTCDLRSVYCDMNRTFGGNSTGWMRVAELDVNNCPPGLRREITNSVNTCVVIEDNAGCTEINYPVYNISYSQITGQVMGYQIRSLDGFVLYNRSISRSVNFTNLNDNYLDGVGISTNGRHVWSFAAGCNCLHPYSKPTIIGEDYTCDGAQARQHYDLLWVSQQCGRTSTWFYKVLTPTTTDIKVRICRDQYRADEDLALKTLELYIQ